MFRHNIARTLVRQVPGKVVTHGAGARRAFAVSAGRKAEVEITIDGKKVMIEQVRFAWVVECSQALGLSWEWGEA